MTKIIETALKYQEMGFSVIPIRPENKKPLIKWETYQKERADAETIESWGQRWPSMNLGIVTGAVSGIDAVDCDSVKGVEAVSALLPDSLELPISQTPGGGNHFYFEHRDGVGCATRFMEDTDLRGDGGYIIVPPSVGENGKRYAWIESIFEVPLPEMPSNVFNKIKASLYRATSDRKSPTDFKRLQVTSSDFKEGMRDEALFHLANCLFKGGMADDNILKYMLFFGSNCSPPFPEKEILAKIESAKKRNFNREMNISEEVRDYIVTSSGFFLTSDVFKRLQVTSRPEKKAVVLELLRLHKKGLIERHGTQNGCYRKIEEAPAIDFLNASDRPFDIQWPFNLQAYALIHPKNIIVIAGTQNAGKTSLALNVTRMNMQRYSGKIRYVSSEMGGNELKGRLQKFDVPLEDWKAVDFREKSSNFSDIIMPDGLNVIDFYEISDKFWLIADDLKRIYEKLNQGIAIVCLQKSPGKSEGRGGDFGLEKPRLYLNLDPDPPDGAVLTIRKAKAWAKEGRNPNHYKTRFKIVNGAKLIQQGSWFLESR